MSTHITLIAIMLFILPLQSMKNSTQLAVRAEEKIHNSYSLTDLPKETLMQIFSYCISDEKFTHYDCDLEIYDSSLKRDIKKFMQLSIMCARFNKLLTLETIGNFCKTYSKKYKHDIAIRLLKDISAYIDYLDPIRDININNRSKKCVERIKYHKERIKSLLVPALIAVYADVYESPLVVHTSYSNSSLCKAALLIDDAKLLTTLIKNCHLNQACATLSGSYPETPPSFFAKTVEMAQVIIDNRFYHNDYTFPNILWHTINYGYPAEVMELYIKDGVLLNRVDKCGNCLLHMLARIFYRDKNDSNFLKKVELMLKYIPDMINTLNNSEQTPLDIAQQVCTRATSEDKELILQEFEKFNTLLRNNGGLTAQEVAYNATLSGKIYKTITNLF